MADLSSVITALQQGVVAINNLALSLGGNVPTTFNAESISIATSGDNTIITAATGTSINVYKMFLVTAGSTISPLPTMSIQGGTTPLTGPITFSSVGGSELLFEYDEKPWLTCPTNTSLIFTLSASLQLSGRIYFTQK